MPRGRKPGSKNKPKVKEEPTPNVPDVPREDPFEESMGEVEVQKEDKLEMPTFEGAKVVKVLEDNHTNTHYHCKLDDGTTKHVPKSLFE